MTAIDEADKLAPCPFCDGPAQLTKGEARESVWPHGAFHRVFCGGCQVQQRFHRTAAEAIAAWNTRRSPEAAAQALRERGWTVVEPGGETLAEGVG